MIIIVMGLPGTGKTYFAEHLTAHIQAIHISSDKTRNRLQKRGNYAPEDKDQVYREMLVQAEEALKNGQDVIMDATYSQKAHRDEVGMLAQRLATPLHFIQLTADEETIRERTSKERPDSEADFQVYQLIKQSFEPLEIPHLKLHSGQLEIEEMLAIAQNYITS
jgi:predicted kinase